ncbi:transcriptional regulator [Pyrococcus sp. NA2]|uniref:Lrp/AsnC family transcriptional regulator n=1 Tax=Pyrococcus sp. (strain NA2) TaxID=342949 RepID=UPI000209B036|nr:Lrp/AsnC family transcriptional regulator [Pyrococcus sp. NA2]AEC51203.1 transcriptional regulator [Pyrococcus sp. NA2]
MELDELDRKIIDILLRDSRTSYREIAKELNVAVGTIYNRIKKLEDSGIIQGFTVKLNYEHVGYELTAIMGIKAQGKKIREIERIIAKDKRVMCVYDVTGDYDIIVIAKFRNREEMNGFVKSVLSIDGVEKTNTHVVLEIVKEDFRLEL